MGTLQSLSGRAKLVIAAVAVVLIAAPAALYLLTRPPWPVDGDLCRQGTWVGAESKWLARLEEYEPDRLTEYDSGPAEEVSVLADDVRIANQDLFERQSCTYPGLALFAAMLMEVVDTPGHNGPDNPAAPADLETAYFDELGAEGLVTGWGLGATRYCGGTFWETDDGPDTPPPFAVEAQEMLGIGLAHVTNPDRETLIDEGNYTELILDPEYHLGEEYTSRFIELGSSQVPLVKYAGSPVLGRDDEHTEDLNNFHGGEWEIDTVGPTVYGWSVLAPLLRFGDFHEDFLTPVATAVIEFDIEHGGDWTVEGEDPLWFDLTLDEPTNAIDAVLEALSRNPAAAEAVFEATGDDRVAELRND
ncbi:hypothetical protein L0U85_15880 [Glycomyces sp. L485]|uniref:hypothetical protein n=1 Tax=Glycomyces sp. L485 TaxID=2909235 RepID=UPI001F4B570A|nr:hypothetical protein [Glycomyces sp. L485]MCH7232324.1 hypothetical protein [Glycomyces sp. L485]